jgi:hypothetical protein
VEHDYQATLKLLKHFDNLGRTPARPKGLKEEALKLHSYAKERTASLSDLVAVLRSL